MNNVTPLRGNLAHGASNNPPILIDERPDTLAPLVKDIDAMLKNADRWFAERAEVKDDTEAGLLAGAIEQLRQWDAKVEAARVAEKAPYLEGERRVDAKWKPLKVRIEKAARVLKAIATVWAQKLRTKQQEAARIAREEADRLAAEARDLIDQAESGAANATTLVRAEEVAEQAEDAAAIARQAEAAKPQLSGNLTTRALSLRSRRVVDEITDIGAAMDHYATDPEMLTLLRRLGNRDLRADQALASIPGCSIRTEEGVV